MTQLDSKSRLSEIGQISVTVHNLETAVEFYRDLLDLQFIFQVHNMAFFDCDGVRLMLAIPEQAEDDHPSSVIYFKVGDIDAAFESLTGRGVQFRGEPHLIAKLEDHDLWMAFFVDLDSNTLALMSEVPRT